MGKLLTRNARPHQRTNLSRFSSLAVAQGLYEQGRVWEREEALGVGGLRLGDGVESGRPGVWLGGVGGVWGERGESLSMVAERLSVSTIMVDRLVSGSPPSPCGLRRSPRDLAEEMAQSRCEFRARVARFALLCP